MTGKALQFVLGGIAGALGAYALSLSSGSSGDVGSAGDSPPEGSTPETLLAPADLSEARTTSADDAAVDRFEERVARDPIAALTDAAAIPEPAARRRAVMLIGALWARTDPVGALQQAYRLPSALEADFQASVSSEWANLNAGEFLRYASSAPDPEALTEGLELLIASDPAKVLEIADRLPREAGDFPSGGMNALERSALNVLAERDPAAAMRYLEPILPSIDMNVAVQETIRRFARTDPDAALTWLSSLGTAKSTYIRVVLRGIAQADFPRAFRVAAEQTAMEPLEYALGEGALGDPASASAAATFLVNDGSAFAAVVLDVLAEYWASRDPDRFTEWFVEHSASISMPMVRSAASRFATRDLGSAMRLVERLPPGMRSAWIAEVAGSYASRDPRAALDWIEQYRGQPFYDDARSQVVVRVADTNPQLAATMLDGLDPALRAVAAPRIAAGMSERDPQAAAEWAVGLEDRTLASEAASEVVRAWVRRDVEGVRRWVLGLERGEFRDDALATLAGATYGTGLDPLPLLAEIESKEALDRGRYSAVLALLSSRPEAAQELLEALLDHPVYGDWARDTLARSTDP